MRVVAGSTHGVDDDDVEGERQERQNDEEDEDGDPSGRGETAVQLAVVEVVERRLRHGDQHCDRRQRHDDLLGASSRAQVHCLHTPPLAARVHGVMSAATQLDSIDCYSTVALVPPMSTMDVWRGIT